MVYGEIVLFNIEGLDFALTAVERTLEDLFNFCKGSVHVEIFDTGKSTYIFYLASVICQSKVPLYHSTTRHDD